MAKHLISEACITAAVREGRTIVTFRPGALITPLARDLARDKNIALVEESPVVTDIECGCAAGAPLSPAPRVIAIGSDHGGFSLKQALVPLVKAEGWQVLDLGTESEEACDYPDFAFAVARAIALGKARLGVMIDGAGLGSAMVCNKVPGVRAACCYNEFTAWNARAHNDANVLTLGSRTLGIEVCKSVLKKFLSTDFEGGRHAGRVQKIADVEERFLPRSELSAS
jgi:ribose 5-phosphate isomerase B